RARRSGAGSPSCRTSSNCNRSRGRDRRSRENAPARSDSRRPLFSSSLKLRVDVPATIEHTHDNNALALHSVKDHMDVRDDASKAAGETGSLPANKRKVAQVFEFPINVGNTA